MGAILTIKQRWGIGYTALFISALFLAGPALAQVGDTDGDGVMDIEDNCIDHPNGPLLNHPQDTSGISQRDTNNDGIGNVCDTDLDNDGVVNGLDVGQLRQAFLQVDTNSYSLDADFNGDGVVNGLDTGILRQFFLQTPGPVPQHLWPEGIPTLPRAVTR